MPIKRAIKIRIMSTSETSHMVNMDGAYKKTNQNEELVKFKEVKGTPFTVATDENGHHVLLGNKRFSTHEIHSDAVKEAKEVTWDKIFIVLGIAMEKFSENLKG